MNYTHGYSIGSNLFSLNFVSFSMLGAFSRTDTRACAPVLGQVIAALIKKVWIACASTSTIKKENTGLEKQKFSFVFPVLFSPRKMHSRYRLHSNHFDLNFTLSFKSLMSLKAQQASS